MDALWFPMLPIAIGLVFLLFWIVAIGIGVYLIVRILERNPQAAPPHPDDADGAPEDRPYRKLYRSEQEKMVSGVCGGIASYFRVDPTVVRLGFVAFTFLSGLVLGFVTYVLCVFIVPTEPQPAA